MYQYIPVLYDTVVRGTHLQTDQLSTKTALQVPTLQNCCDADPYELLYGPRSKSWIRKFSIRIQVKQNNQFFHLRTLFWSFCLNYLLWICDPPIGAAHCTVSCNVNLMTLWQFRKNQIFCGPLHRSFVDGWPQPFTRTNSSGLPGLPDHWNWMHSRNHSSRGAECDSRFHRDR